MKDNREEIFGRPIEDILNGFFLSPFFANVKEEEEFYSLELSLPGFRGDEIKVVLESGMLTVIAESGKEQDVALLCGRTEFKREYYQRRFVMPQDADHLNIQAILRDGLLMVRIGKRPNAKGNSPINVNIK